jgi:uncharacterized protein YjbI with pentapeptide repeats
MTQSNQFERAKQGQPDAIAALMNSQLKAKGIQVQARRQDHHLQMRFKSSKVPQAQSLTAWVRKGLERLSPKGIERVQLEGWKHGASRPAWVQTFALTSPAAPPAPKENKLPPDPLSLQERALQGDSEAIATLANAVLNPDQIEATVTLRDRSLTVTVSGTPTPAANRVKELLQTTLDSLRPEAFETIQLEGKASREDFLTWSHNWDDISIVSSPQVAREYLNPRSILFLILSFLGFLILCFWLKFNLCMGLSLALIPATLADRKKRSFINWYAYGLILYYVAIFQATFIDSFNPYGLVLFAIAPLWATNTVLSLGVFSFFLYAGLAFIPARIAAQKNRRFLNWYVYGFALFFVALFHALLLRSETLKNVKNTNLENQSFANADLAGMNFQNSNLTGVDFSNSRLVAADFRGANLTHANFSHANIWAAKFSQANLHQANFSSAHNRWQGRSRSRVEFPFPWWITVGLGLIVIQLFALTAIPRFLSFQQTAFQFLPLPSWLEWLPVLATFSLAIAILFVTGINLGLTNLGHRQANTVAAILIGIAVLTGFSTVAIVKGFTIVAGQVLSLIIIVKLLVLGIATWQAIVTIRKHQNTRFSVWIGIILGLTILVFIFLISSNLFGDIPPFVANIFLSQFDFLLPWLSLISSLLAIGAIAYFTIWGAVIGFLASQLLERRITCFRGANLTGATFQNANLINVNFQNATVTDVNLETAKIRNAIAPDGKVFSRGIRR